MEGKDVVAEQGPLDAAVPLEGRELGPRGRPVPNEQVLEVRGLDRPPLVPQLPVIVVQGQGSVETVPDIADVVAGVTTRAETARKALDANNAAMDRLMKTLRDAKIDDEDVRTSGFGISPYYERHEPNKPRRIAGYQASNQVTVTVRALKRVGRVIDAMVTAGSNRVNGVRFRVSKPEALLDRARRLAVKDAMRRARLYADAADVDLGDVKRIEERRADIPRPRMLAASALGSARDVPVAPGTQTLSATISMWFELDD